MKTTLLMAAGHDISIMSRTMAQGITLRSILLTTLLFLWPLLTAGRAETFEDFIYSTNGASATIVRYTGTNQNVTIPDYIAEVPVETIADSAFAGCTNLFVVVVPYTVTNLGSAVFEGCYTLGSAYFQGNAPTVPASEDVFNGATNVTVYHWSGAEGWGSTFCGQPARIGTDTMSALFLFQQHGPTLTVTGYVGPGGDIIVPLLCGDTFVTIIGDAAFSGYTNLTKVVIRQGINTIGDRAFEGCINLANVDMMQGINMIGDRAFEGCINLTNVVLMQGLNMIGDRAFEGCINLTNVVIRQGLDRIGDLAFQGCSNLAGVYFEGDAPTISGTGGLFEGAGQATVFYRPGTKGWGTTFGGRPTAVWVDPSAPDFQYEQTAYTMSIAGYTGAASSITIPVQIFHYTVISIGDSAFEGYSNLTSVVVPMVVTRIGNAAFSECTKLANIVLPSSMVSMGNEAFQGCSSLTNIAIPGGVTTIGDAAFAHCTGLGYIEIPHSVTNIGKSVFAGCSSLRTIALGNGITAIPDYAFQGCSGLESIAIPGGVTHLGQEVFLGCQSLTKVYFQGDAPTLSEPGDAFEGVTNLTVYYRAGTAGWGTTFAGHPTVLLTDPAGTNFSYVQNGPTITITGYTGSNDTVVIPNKIFGKPVVAIGDSAFSGCTNLAEIFMPDSITNIGNSAFAYCVSLTNVTIPVGVSCIGSQAFLGCSNLTNVYILRHKTVDLQLGDRVFEDCASLLAVCFYGRAPVIVQDANPFAGATNVTVYYRSGITGWTNNLCGRPTALWVDPNASLFTYEEHGSTVAITGTLSNRTNVIVPSTLFGKRVTSILDLVPGEVSRVVSVTIPNSVTNLGDSLFGFCHYLTSVTLPNSITTLPPNIFNDCTALTNITIPVSVTNIGKNAFAACSRLKDMSIPDGVVTIGEGAFSSCSNLTSFHIPGGVRSIGNSAFQQCNKLTNVAIANGLTNLGYKAFYLCTNLVSITLPDTLTTIGGSAFSGCRKLVSIVILKGVTDIQSKTFYDCWSLAVATLPVGVTNLGDYAFSNCTNLTRLTMPDTVTRIGPSAFERCIRLDTLLFEGDVPKVYDNTVFSGCGRLIVYYHSATTGWGVTMAGRPTAIWDRLVPYEQWAEGYGLPTQYPDACGEMDDPDLDGVTNIQELRSGTDPTNPNSLFAFEKSPRPDDLSPADKTAISSWQYAFYFGTVLRKRYVVQRSESLAGPWFTVDNFTATTTQKRVVTDKWFQQGFYRAYQLP